MTVTPVTALGNVATYTQTTRANAPADTRLATLLAGQNMALAELVTGAPAFTGAAPSSNRNPQGTVGVDLSGPPWGPCRKGPVWTFSGSKTSTGGAGAFGFTNVHYWDTVDIRNPSLLVWWSKPFASGPTAPMSRLRLFLVVGNLTASATTARFTVFRDSVVLGTVDVSLTATTADKVVDTGIDIPNFSGWNRVNTRWERLTGSAVPVVLGASLCVTRSLSL